MTSLSEAPSLVEAFPNRVRIEAGAALSVMPEPKLPCTLAHIGAITLDAEQIKIPFRIYHREPGDAVVNLLSPVARVVLACLYTRHHDGHVRQRALCQALEADETWVVPFVVQLLGEYVLEISQIVDHALATRRKESVVAFLRQNPTFLDLTAQRATSYWNCYYRTKFPAREDYPALHAIGVLRAWLQERSLQQLPNQPLQPTSDGKGELE